jgi:hypothetical protein
MSATYDSAQSAQPRDPRAAATVTLLAVTLVAAFGLQLSLPAGMPLPSATATVTPAERVPAAPVKIIGASPRSDACDAQVWPYIEGRCLVRAPAAPRAETTAAAAPPAASRAETTGSAPAVPPSVAAEARTPVRAAASHLQLPPRRAAASSATDAWMDDDVAEPSYGTRSRRAGRRGYRDERNSRRRRAFPFFFR